MKDGVEEVVPEVSEAELLLENVCEVFEKDGRRETKFGVCVDKKKEAGGAHMLTGEGCVRVGSWLCGIGGVLD